MDNDMSYVSASAFRFLNGISKEKVDEIYKDIKSGKEVDLSIYEPQELKLPQLK